MVSSRLECIINPDAEAMGSLSVSEPMLHGMLIVSITPWDLLNQVK